MTYDKSYLYCIFDIKGDYYNGFEIRLPKQKHPKVEHITHAHLDFMLDEIAEEAIFPTRELDAFNRISHTSQIQCIRRIFSKDPSNLENLLRRQK